MSKVTNKVNGSNQIHSTAVIDSSVVMGEGNVIGAGVIIYPGVRLENNNWIGPYTVIGAPPEIRNWKHPGFEMPSSPVLQTVSIGSNNIIREQVIVHSGSKGETKIEDDCFLMNSTYIAHDVTVCSKATLASGVRLAGHVVVEELANLGMGALVHQFRRIGAGAFVGMGSVVTKNVFPFAMAYGVPATIKGVNETGLSRLGIERELISKIVLSFEEGAEATYLSQLATLGMFRDLTFWKTSN